MRAIILFFVLLSGCFGKCPGEPATVTDVEEVLLPYKVPSGRADTPRFFSVRDMGDGRTIPIPVWGPSSEMPKGKDGVTYTKIKDQHTFEWGRRYRIQTENWQESILGTKQYKRKVVKVLEDVEDISAPFELKKIDATYFEDSRTFIDGKPIECASEDVCKALENAIESKKLFGLKMRFGASWDAPLIVTSVDSATEE